VSLTPIAVTPDFAGNIPHMIFTAHQSVVGFGVVWVLVDFLVIRHHHLISLLY
jgi:hypothetical protein